MSSAGTSTRCSAKPSSARCLAPAAAAPVVEWDGSASTRLGLPAAGASVSLPPAPAGYEILDILGRGGMGVVYKARHLALKRLVALKMVATGGQATPEERARFRAEAEAVASLSHPNIVQLYEVGEHHGCPFCTLEFVDGPNLAEVLAAGPLPVRGAAALVRTLAEAVQHAHQRGILHRDLKPGNVLLASVASCQPPVVADRNSLATDNWRRATGNWQAKIADFGLAKRLRGSARLTRSGQVLGTPNYMAPEQATGDHRSFGPATDVYALGAILYECLTGQPPFKGESTWDVLTRVIHAEVPPLPGHVPAALATVCLKALAKDPQRRYASAAELAADLDRFLDGVAVRARREGWLRRQARQARRRPAVVGTALLALVLVGTVGGFAWVEENRLRREAEAALSDGQDRLDAREYAEAARTLGRGVEIVRQAHGGRELALALENRLAQARRGLAAGELHQLAERVRFLFDAGTLSVKQRRALEASCRKVWEARDRLLDAHGLELAAETEQGLRTDLLDLALFWTDLHIGLAAAEDRDAARRRVLAVLDDAEALVGPSPVLARQRMANAAALGWDDVAEAAALQAEQLPPRSAWEHYALGRSLLRAGRLDEAARALKRAVVEHPQGFWPHFYRAVCAQKRQRHEEAVEELGICLAFAPRTAACYHNRALARTALGQIEEALEDYDQALRLDPTLAAAALNRGLLHGRRGDHERALSDLAHALDHGADPVAACYNLAVIHTARGETERARARLDEALRHNPDHQESRSLRQRLEPGP